VENTVIENAVLDIPLPRRRLYQIKLLILKGRKRTSDLSVV